MIDEEGMSDSPQSGLEEGFVEPEGCEEAVVPDDPSADQVAAWLKSHGYLVDPPGGFVEHGEEEYSGGYGPEDDPYVQLEEEFKEAYAEEEDEGERAALVVEFNRRARALDRQAEGERYRTFEQVQAFVEGQAYVPAVAEQFEAKGIPREAASDFVSLLAMCPAEHRASPEVQAVLLQRAVGRAVLGGAGAADEVPLPRGESPGGGPAIAVDGVSPEVLASIRQNFPQIGPLTPAKVAKLKREGIF